MTKGRYKSWPVAINVAEPEGRWIWDDGCPFANGTLVYLQCVQLPDVAVVVADDKSDPKLGAILELGPFPSDGDWPFRVGCQLYAIPAYLTLEPLVISANAADPVDGDLSGIDLSRLAPDRVDVWATATAGDSFSVQPWVQNNRGIWAKRPDLGGVAPSLTKAAFAVDTHDAERLFIQTTFDMNPPAGDIVIHFGRFTASALNQVVRFAAVTVE